MTLHSEMQLALSTEREKELYSQIEGLRSQLEEQYNIVTKLKYELEMSLELLYDAANRMTPHSELWPTEEKLRRFFVKFNMGD